MRVTILQHADYEDAGYAEIHLQQVHNATINRVMMHQPGFTLPDASELDMLLICGGPMGATDDDEYPWISSEKTFIRQMIESGKTVLGICLGGQLIAAAMGADISMNPQPEIGWFPLLSETPADSFHFPQNAMVMQWHYQTFALPSGARRLASTATCANQAYQLGDKVIGLQCHPEMTAEGIRYLVSHFPEELKPLAGIQSAEEIEQGVQRYAAAANGIMADLVDYLLAVEG